MYAFTNLNDLKPGKVRGIVLNFHGLGDGTQMITDADAPMVKYYTERDTVFCYPYCGPWHWMNFASRELCDELIDLFIKELDLPEDIPVVPTGGSMGGFSSLVFSMTSRHNIVGCAANCPVCDLTCFLTEREDVPRTLRAAYGGCGDDFEEVLRKSSPLYQVDKMPFVPYFVAHGDLDYDVHKELHSDKFVAEMRKLGHDITYFELPGRRHMDLPPDVSEKYLEFPFTII